MEKFFDICKVMFVSSLPLIEIRGGIPFAIIMGFSKRESFLYGVIGNAFGLLAAFIILDHLLPYFKRVKLFRKLYLISTRRARRNRTRYVRLRYLALYLLVAVPLPGTGAWTAALVSYLFRFERRKSFLIIFAGILTVGVILTAGVITIRGIRLIL